LEVSILFIASSGSKRFSVFHATRYGTLRYEAVLLWRTEFGFIHPSILFLFYWKILKYYFVFSLSDNENSLHLFHGFDRICKELNIGFLALNLALAAI
jgi:hypothetical protein